MTSVLCSATSRIKELNKFNYRGFYNSIQVLQSSSYFESKRKQNVKLNVQPIATYLNKAGSNFFPCFKSTIGGRHKQCTLLNNSTYIYRYNTHHCDVSQMSLRSLHLSAFLCKEESNVTKTVKVLKSSDKKQVRIKEQLHEKKPASTTLSSSTISDVKETEVVLPKKTLAQRIVAEIKHYYHGFRLLGIDMKISTQLLWRVLKGSTLSRRERRQLVRTTSDLFRIVPFLVFVIVPFMEFLLPVAIKLFPNMLPSTFQEADKEREKRKKILKVKLSMAQFLQETIEESALVGKQTKDKTTIVKEFANFMESIRSSGTMASSEEIKKYCQIFEDEITLDNLNRMQLVALCKLLELQTIGTVNFLRFQIRMRLRHLKADDKLIRNEGINTLTARELQVASRERGMRSLGISEERMKEQLSQWIKLHLDDDIPVSLLLLSRAMYLPEELSAEGQLTKIIASLPDTSADEAKVKIAEITGEAVDNAAKLKLIKQEQLVIKQERKEQEEMKAKEEADIKMPSPEVEVSEPATILDEIMHDKAEILEAKATEDLNGPEISAEDLESLENAIDCTLAEKKEIQLEREALESLKEDVSEYQEDLEDLKEVVVATGLSEKDIGESKSARNLSRRLNTMITQMDSQINDLHKERYSLMEDIEIKEVKMRHHPEILDDPDQKQEILSQIQEKKTNIIKVNELVLGMKRFQKITDEVRLQKIAEFLDDDHDGNINLDSVMRVLKLIGQDNIKLSAREITDIIKILKEENEIEDEERRKQNDMNAFFKKLDEEKAQLMQELKGDSQEFKNAQEKQQNQ